MDIIYDYYYPFYFVSCVRQNHYCQAYWCCSNSVAGKDVNFNAKNNTISLRLYKCPFMYLYTLNRKTDGWLQKYKWMNLGNETFSIQYKFRFKNHLCVTSFCLLFKGIHKWTMASVLSPIRTFFFLYYNSE